MIKTCQQRRDNRFKRARDKYAFAGQLVKDSQERTAGKEQLGKSSWERTAGNK
jgi:hypothetical protein